MKQTTQESGFSLFELVVTVAILTVVMGAAFNLMTRSQVSYDANQIQAEAHANADFAVNRVTEIIRGAGSNPTNLTTVNWIDFLTNPDSSSVRVKSDLNGDGDVSDRVDAVSAATTTQYHIISSEDVTLRYYPTETVVSGVTIPARTICMIDNTPVPGTTASYDLAPIVIAQNILSFSCPAGSNPREVTLSITAGPSRAISTSDPRYRSYATSARIRLRNR